MSNRILFVTCVVFIMVFGMLGVEQVSASGNDRHLVLFKGNEVPRAFASDVEALGGSVVFSHKVGFAIVEGLDDGAAAQIGANSKVSAIEPDETFFINPIMGGAERINGMAPESPADPTSAAAYARQWNMRAIGADVAWANGRLGSSGVTVAILDSGIDYDYPDLWYLVDLSRSVSFVPDDDALVDAYFPGKHYVTDLYFHGTHVAATVASNALILAGVTSQTTLMGVKVCGVNGSCSSAAVLAGVLHAADNGADVANMSLGGGFYRAQSKGYVGYINRIFNYANSAGMTIVVSAGNNAWDLDHFSNVYKTYCSAPNTICVSATGPTSADDIYVGPWYNVDDPASYTNYGRSAINVAAPGGTSAGYVWAGCSTTSLFIPKCQTEYFIIGATGTSMAAPHVSGLAALVVEDVGRNPGRVRAKIQQTADDLGQRGTDPFYGKGRINVGTYTGN